ncbi:MAG: hypothetical protein U1F45_00170 [Burkholderiales bacterium]
MRTESAKNKPSAEGPFGWCSAIRSTQAAPGVGEPGGRERRPRWRVHERRREALVLGEQFVRGRAARLAEEEEQHRPVALHVGRQLDRTAERRLGVGSAPEVLERETAIRVELGDLAGAAQRIVEVGERRVVVRAPVREEAEQVQRVGVRRLASQDLEKRALGLGHALGAGVRYPFLEQRSHRDTMRLALHAGTKDVGEQSLEHPGFDARGSPRAPPMRTESAKKNKPLRRGARSGGAVPGVSGRSPA